jgi:tetratricopeptide (TPR) repeat protein
MDLSKTQNLRKAQELIEQGKLTPAITIYRKIVDDDSSDLGAVSTLSDLYVKTGRINEATEHFLQIADKYLRNGSAISAAYILNKVLKLSPTNPTAHMNLGKLHLLDGKTDLAHAHFIEAGAAFWHKADTAAALKMNQQALAIKPNSKQAKAAIALIQQEIDQTHVVPRKEIEPKPQVELEPIFISVVEDSAEVVTHEEPTLHQEIVPELTPPPADDPQLQSLLDSNDSLLKQETLQPLDEDALIDQFATAEVLVGYGEGDQAIRLLRRALFHNPDHIEIRAKLKDIYLRLEMIDRASEECVNIAAIYAARGDESRAREYVVRARLLGDSVETADALAILKQCVVNEPNDLQDSAIEWKQPKNRTATVM